MRNFQREAVVYSLALAFLALMAMGSYFIVDSIVMRQQHMASMIDLSSRQRMLSQRIALLSLQLTQSKTPSVREQSAMQLRESVDLMRRSHRDLVEGSLAQGIEPPTQPDLKAIYFAAPHALNRRVPEFLDLADQVLTATEQNQLSAAQATAVRVAAAANDDLLNALDMAVNQYAANSEEIFRQSQLRILIVTVAMLIALSTEALFIFRPLLRRMGTLVDMAQSDPLTGSLNRRSFLDAATRDFARSRRTGSPLSVIFFDIDHFKKINDTYGHAVGDAVIRDLTERVKSAIRTTDMLGRMGGEEFVVLLPDTDCQSAVMVAEKLRLALETLAVNHENITLRFTASFGVTQIAEQDADPLNLIERADGLMYQAKHCGRNCVRNDDPLLAQPAIH